MDRLLYSTDTDSGTVTLVRPEDGAQVAVIEVGNGPRGAVQFTAAGRGFVANHAGDTISEISAAAQREVRRIKVGIAPIGVAILPDDRYLITSNAGENSVSIVDLQTNEEVHRIDVGREPRHPAVSADGRFAYIPNSASHSIVKIDLSPLLADNPVLSKVVAVATIDLPDGAFPYSCAISPDGKFAVAANNQATFVSLIDTATDTVSEQIDVGVKGARGAAYDKESQTAFVSLENSSEIAVISLTSRTVVNTLVAANGPRGLFYDDERLTLYCSAFDRTKPDGRGYDTPGNSISVISFDPNGSVKMFGDVPLQTFPVGAGPCSVSVYPK